MRIWLVFLALALLPVSAAAQPPATATAQPLYLFLYRPGPNWRAGVPMHQQDLRAHALYHRDLVRDGRSFAAGGYDGLEGGMAIVRAADAAAARAIMAADPAIVNGVFAGEIRPWTPRYFTAQPIVAGPR